MTEIAATNSQAQIVRVTEAIRVGGRFTEGSDGDAIGPPEIISEHVPVPLEQSPGSFRGIRGFGRVVLGDLPNDYPPSASRLTLKDIRVRIQLCTDVEDTGAPLWRLSAYRAWAQGNYHCCAGGSCSVWEGISAEPEYI